MTKIQSNSTRMVNFRGERTNFRPTFGALSAHFRATFGVAFLGAPQNEKLPLFSRFLRICPKTHRSGKNRKTPSYIYFNRTHIHGPLPRIYGLHPFCKENLTICRMVWIASIYAAYHQAVYRFGHNAIRAPRPL